MLSDFEKHWMY